LISALRKKRPKKESISTDSKIWFDEGDNEMVGPDGDDVDYYNPDEEDLYKNNNEEIINQNSTAMGIKTSINDPPDQNLMGQKISEISENETSNLMEQKNTKKKKSFDGKKAIIYSTIINRKQF
jgi:hypothetical protein